MHCRGAQEARFTDELGISIGVRRSFPAEIPTAAAKFAARPHDAVHEVLTHFLSRFLAERFVGREYFRFCNAADFGVVLAGAGELIDIALAIERFESDPTIAVVAAVGV